MVYNKSIQRLLSERAVSPLELANYCVINNLSIGQSNNAFTINKFGHNLDIDTNVEEDIWSYGGTRVYFNTAENFNIASSSINDISAGSGARTITIQGLDSDYNYQAENITLNGTTNVPTVNQYIEVWRARVLTSGGVNNANLCDGNINITGVTSGNVIAQIPIGANITQQTHFTIPAGYTGYFIHRELSVFRAPGTGGGAREGEIYYKYKPFGASPLQSGILGLTSTVIEVESFATERLEEKTLIWFAANTAANNTAAAAEYVLLCVEKGLTD